MRATAMATGQCSPPPEAAESQNQGTARKGQAPSSECLDSRMESLGGFSQCLAQKENIDDIFIGIYWRRFGPLQSAGPNKLWKFISFDCCRRNLCLRLAPNVSVLVSICVSAQAPKATSGGHGWRSLDLAKKDLSCQCQDLQR